MPVGQISTNDCSVQQVALLLCLTAAHLAARSPFGELYGSLNSLKMGKLQNLKKDLTSNVKCRYI